MADLETALGTRLLIREPRGARLTEAGEFLAGYLSIIRSRDVPMTPLAAHLTATLRRVLGSTGAEIREPSAAQTG